MRRREFLVGSFAISTASALRAAEPNRVYRLAAGNPFGMPIFSTPLWTHLFDRLSQLDYTESKNLIVDRYTADERPERFAELAVNIVRSKPDVIVLGWDNQLISEVAKAASSIPIAAMLPSLAAGHVKNIARPEGNITGIALDAGIEMQGKHLDILREAVPSISRVAYLSNRDDWEGAWGHAIVEAGRQSGIAIIGIRLKHSAEEPEYREAFETMSKQSADALMFNGLAPNVSHPDLIAELALEYRLPSICWFVNLVKKGRGLLSYSPDYGVEGAALADQVAQILKGVKIADIPVTQPTKFTLAINLKTAKALGLELPAGLVARADEVIE